ncbi:hypothetical protein [Haladaptatus caseinilyticus]|uniref:hypothetical protein n=1 Tax=Haladaptatus caseinilyticus TaxID=2993314 RepID=UPI00224B5558|nr:hypothetical protein [Haladaptatus caseinilyticus]
MSSTENDSSPESPSNDIAQRSKSRNQVLEWILIEGNRLLITVGGSAMIFVLFLLLSHYGVIAFTNENSVTRMASGMIAGTFSLVTLVVSVNQLILSQEFSPAGDFRDRLDGVLDFRQDVEQMAGVPATPAAPSQILLLLATAIQHRANSLATALGDHDDEEYRARAVQFANSVAESTEQIDKSLDQTGETAFDTLSVAVNYDDVWQLYATKHLRNDASSLSEETAQNFDDLIDLLQLFRIAQEHFKTVYLQRELTRFSQLTIYCGIPAVLAAVLITVLYGDIGGGTIAVMYLPYVTSFLATLVFVPLVLLAAYILRTATLTRRSAAIGPILPQKDSNEGPFEVSYNENQ